MQLVEYSPEYQQQVKQFVITSHEEFGFPYDRSLDFDLDDPKKEYLDKGGMFYILLDNGTVAGTVAVEKIDDDTARLKRMYVSPPHRGKGFGKKLFRKAMSFCKKKRFKKCILDTNKAQAAAQGLYIKHGFKIDKVVKNTLFMSKDIKYLF